MEDRVKLVKAAENELTREFILAAPKLALELIEETEWRSTLETLDDVWEN